MVVLVAALFALLVIFVTLLFWCCHDFGKLWENYSELTECHERRGDVILSVVAEIRQKDLRIASLLGENEELAEKLARIREEFEDDNEGEDDWDEIGDDNEGEDDWDEIDDDNDWGEDCPQCGESVCVCKSVVN